MCLAIPAQIVEFHATEENRALVDVSGVRRYVDTGLLTDETLLVGDWVLLHVGFALSKISEEQARDQLRTLSLLGEDLAVLEEISGYGVEEPAPPPNWPEVRIGEK